MRANDFCKILLCTAAVVLTACGSEQPPTPTESAAASPGAEPATPATPGLEDLLASDSRSEADRARDAGRKPAEVLEFLGIRPGMKVIDIIAAGGWYTEVLALAVGPDGHVVAQNPSFVLTYRDGALDEALDEAEGT